MTVLYVHLSGCEHRGKWSYQVTRREVKYDTKEYGNGQSREGSTNNAQDEASHTETLHRGREREKYELYLYNHDIVQGYPSNQDTVSGID